MPARVNNELCTGCGRCIDECPVGAITLNEQIKKAVIDETLCIECGICVDKCKKGAISLGSSNPSKENRLPGRNSRDSMSGRGSGTGRHGRGQGGGECGRRAGSSIAGECLCLQCKTVIPHAAGTPCNETKCPKCGASMVRK